MRSEFWDYPPTKHYHRKAQRPTVEVLEPREEQPRVHRVEIVHYRRHTIAPQAVTVAAIILLGIVLLRSPAALIMLAVLLMHPTILIAAGGFVALVVIIAAHERYRGRPF
jgi:hypothetical protein